MTLQQALVEFRLLVDEADLTEELAKVCLQGAPLIRIRTLLGPYRSL